MPIESWPSLPWLAKHRYLWAGGCLVMRRRGMQLLPPSSGGSLHKRRIGNVPDPFPWKAVWLHETSPFQQLHPHMITSHSIMAAVHGWFH